MVTITEDIIMNNTAILAILNKRVNILRKTITTDWSGREVVSFETKQTGIAARIWSVTWSKRYVDTILADKYDYMIYLRGWVDISDDDIIEYKSEKYVVKKIANPSDEFYIKIYCIK